MSAPAEGGRGGGGGSSEAPPGLPLRPVWTVVDRAMKVRNALTALGIGAVVLGIYGYTFYSISQEHFLDELELEAKAVQAQAAKSSAETG